MKFRFYITDLMDGCIKGTNDEAIARSCATSEDMFVVDTETNMWLTTGEDSEVPEIEPFEEDDEDDDGE